MRHSLRGKLLAWLLGPLVLLLTLNVALTVSNADRTATAVNDRMLLGAARMIGEHVSVEEGALQADIPPAALQLFESRAADDIYYRVATVDGILLAGYPDFPPPPRWPDSDGALHYDATVRGRQVRAVAYAQPVFSAPEAVVVVQVGDTLHGRQQLARAIGTDNLWQQWLLVAVTAVLLMIGLRHSLAPLLRLREQVRGRSPGALEPLDARGVPAELRTLTDALNDYAARLAQYVAAHRRFTDNAAHQLRTPLAVLRMQADFALKTGDPQARAMALRSISESLRQSTRVVNQLLMLSVAEHSDPAAPRETQADLVAVVRGVLEDLAPMANERRMDLGFESGEAALHVPVAPAMLRELVANLVDNALRYTPQGGVVTTVLRRVPGGVELRVEDNGPGIPAAERERVFERFYRLHQQETDGCGLGLAIVREIASAAGANVVLSEAAAGRGLAACVTFR